MIILVCVYVSGWNAQQQHGQTTPALTSSCSRVVLPGQAADSGDVFWQDRWGTHMSLPQCQLYHHWLSVAESWWDHGETAVSECSIVILNKIWWCQMIFLYFFFLLVLFLLLFRKIYICVKTFLTSGKWIVTIKTSKNTWKRSTEVIHICNAKDISYKLKLHLRKERKKHDDYTCCGNLDYIPRSHGYWWGESAGSVVFFLSKHFSRENLPKKTTTTKTPLRFCQVQTHVSLFPALNT